jgi:PAS domain S-box-containing protein
MTIPTRLLATALTSSEQRRSEAEAAHRAELDAQLAFRAVFEQSGALSMLVDPSGSIILLNLSGAKLLGLDGETWVGKSIFELAWVGQDAVPQMERALSRATQGTERLQIEVTGPTGRRHLQLAVSPVKGADGSLRALVVAGLDATRLLEAERDLAHARRLEALGQLAGGVAHDFNNMLMAAHGSLESLREGKVSREERLEALETIEQATHRASELTRKLLAFGRRDRFEKQIVDLGQLVTEAAKLFRRTIGASIQLVLDVGTESMPVEGDAASIEHALMNLMVNARDAMPNGGTVTIRMRVVTVDEDWCKSQTFSVHPGRLVELCIEDDGVGMSDETRARMFEPFFTTKRLGTGSGLGLSAVHGTVLSHGGGISVESQVGSGTRIHLFFPVAAQRPSVRVPTSGIGYSLRLTGTVLVVDDEPLVLRVTKRSLEALGITAILVSDVPSAIAALRTDRRFDCVLTDIVMPKLSGVALVEHIRKIRPDLPVVVMSGFPATAENPTPEALMGCPWLRKPFGRDELAKVLGPILSVTQERCAGSGQLGW